MAEGERPVPFRTRKLSPPAPMVLHSLGCGRVGRRRHSTCCGPPPPGGGPLFLSPIVPHGTDRNGRRAAEFSTSCPDHPQFRQPSRPGVRTGARSTYATRRVVGHERGARTMNAIYLTVPGRIATRPDRLESKNGTGARFRVATTERWFDRTAAVWNDAEPVSLTVVCWRQLAENVLLSLRVGDPVIVHGKLVNSSFERD